MGQRGGRGGEVALGLPVWQSPQVGERGSHSKKLEKLYYMGMRKFVADLQICYQIKDVQMALWWGYEILQAPNS